MAYSEKLWENGERLYAADLNHMESGIKTNDLSIGDLNQLETVTKSNLVAAINEAAQSGGGGAEIYVEGTALVINTDLTNGNEVSY